jgi:hypothetical protein
LAAAIRFGRFASIAAAGHLAFLTRPRAFARHVAELLAPACPPHEPAGIA